MSPRRTTERDGSDGRHRRMSLRQEAETDGPFIFMSFHLGDIRLCHSSWSSPSQRRTSPRRMAPRLMSLRLMSLRRMSLRRMSLRRRKAEREEDRDGCCRDGRCVVVVLFNIVESFSGCYCLIIFDKSSGVCVCGCVCVRVEERMAERTFLLVGYSFDY